MNKPKDPCKVCPFIRQCVAEGEDRRWCFVRILTLEAWDRVEQRRKQELDEIAVSAVTFGPGGSDLCAGCNRKAEYERVGYCLDCARVKL